MIGMHVVGVPSIYHEPDICRRVVLIWIDKHADLHSSMRTDAD